MFNSFKPKVSPIQFMFLMHDLIFRLVPDWLIILYNLISHICGTKDIKYEHYLKFLILTRSDSDFTVINNLLLCEEHF